MFNFHDSWKKKKRFYDEFPAFENLLDLYSCIVCFPFPLIFFFCLQLTSAASQDTGIVNSVLLVCLNTQFKKKKKRNKKTMDPVTDMKKYKISHCSLYGTSITYG